MTRIDHFSIRRKLGLLVLLASVLAMSCVVVAVVFYEATGYQPRAALELERQATILTETLGPALDFADAESAERYLKIYRDTRRDISIATLYDRTGRFFAGDHPAVDDIGSVSLAAASGPTFAAAALSLSRPIERNGQVLGRLFLLERLPPLYARLPQYGIMTGAVAFALLIVAGVLLGGVQRHFIAPLSALVEAAGRIANDEDYTVRAPVARDDEIGRLARSFNRMIEVVGRREAALQRSEAKFATAFVSSPAALTITRIADEEILDVNTAFERLLGCRRSDVIGRTSRELNVWANPDERTRTFRQFALDGVLRDLEVRFRAQDGTVVPCRISSEAVTIAGDACRLTTIVDLTERQRAEEERRRLETQLQQAQRIEAVGRLAGGVAHDFNNMLTVILGQSELALAQLQPGDRLHGGLMQIQRAARHSADLTRQLLAFARRQTVVPQVLDLNATVSGMLKMLQRLIGEDIMLAWRPGDGLGRVKIDPVQVDQILANLCVNARDAIAGVGRVAIETGSATFDETYCAEHPDHLPGHFAMLSVIDDGRGIDGEALQHIFEPFFTTKRLGEGTGLGLSTVFGIVKQNNGFVTVRSEPGYGTTFRVYLPFVAGNGVEPPSRKFRDRPAGHGETVLLVEDEAAILELGRDMLHELGYTVLTAGTPHDAVKLVESFDGHIALLITDVVMPVMNGRDLAVQLCGMRPELKCLFVSGYTASVIAHHGVLDEGVRFLQKPFSMGDLASKVRDALSSAA